jgi:hypothetical protein
MIILDAIKRMTNRSLKRKNVLNFSNFTSKESSDRYIEIRKRGRKLMKYLEFR